MSGPFGSSPWGYNPSTGFYDYTIDQSLRFDGSTSYLEFTPTANAATDSSKMTFSTWVKIWGGEGVSDGYILSAGASNVDGVFYPTYDKFAFVRAGVAHVVGNAVRRDPSAWYHVYVTYDADGDGYARIYVNGVLDNETAQTTDLARLGVQNQLHRLVRKSNAGSYSDFYLAETHFIDGSIVPISTFGETKNGVWVPVQTSGITYGNNGWYLDYADSSDVGKDVSGRGNHWTAYGLAAEDVVPDSPTNNFATWNSIGRMYGTAYSPTTSEGGLKAATAGNSTHVVSTFGIGPSDTQGYYWEVKAISLDTARSYLGIIAPEGSSGSSSGASYSFYYKGVLNRNGNYYGNNDTSSTNVVSQTSWTTNDILMFAYKDGKFWIGKNGTWMNSGDPAAGTGDLVAQDGGRPSDRGDVTWFPYCGYNSTYTANFGQEGTFAGTETAGGNSDENGVGNFKYSVPSGFLAMCSANLPEPSIGPNSDTQSDDYFNTVLYSGNGSSSHGITGVGFQPDWVWIKARNNGSQTHQLLDSVRGKIGAAASFARLRTDTTAVEATPGSDSGLLSLDSDGFTVGTDGAYNNSSYTYVSWNWEAGGSSNTFNIDGTGYADMSSAGLTDGSIALSGLSANTTSGFSVATFTMTSGDSTLAHGLGTEPDLLIFKRRAGSASSWVVWARPFGENTKSNLLLDGTAAAGSSGSGNWIQNITNTLVGIGDYGNMAAAGTHVMYAFASVDGHSKVGSYIGNGNADGTFVYTGFRPAWVMVRRSSSTGGWHIFDNKRPNAYNDIDQRLEADNTDAENTTSGLSLDLLSNGFKFRGTFDNINGNGNTHIYLAFAEEPFKYANAR